MYSSIVNKSIEPCPISSSSSPITTSLISNNDSIPISNNSTSSSLQTYGKKENTLTNISYSSYNCSNDYYTKKRIEELHERMDDIQISSFLKFINYHLSLKKDNEKKIFIKDLSKDLCNGHVLIDLIELFSSTKLKREHGHTRFHSLANVQYVLDYLKIRMQHIDITPYDIVSGNRKQILALLWIIMRIFDLPAFRIANKNCFVEKTLLGFGQDRSTIINWLNNILNQSLNTKEIYIKDFYIHTWDDSYYLSLIIKYLIPLSINYLTNKCFNYLKELDKLNSYDRQRFLLCLNISNYCFNTITIIDLTDKSEKCLFKYFAELKQNILNILKANHIGKLIHNNPYAKQVFDTVIQTETEHSSHVINNNEEYLSCIEDDHQQVSTEKHRRLPMDSIDDITPSLSSSNNIDESSDLRTVERSRSFYDEQQEAKLKRKNSSEKIEDLESNFHMINTHNEMPKEEQTEMITDQSEQLNGLVENLQHSVSSIEQSEQDTNSYIDAEESITPIEDSEQFPSTIEQPTIINNETKEMTLTQIENQLNEKLEQSTDDYEESQQITTSQKEIVQPIENKNSITIDDILEQPIYIIEELSHPIVLIEKSKQITTEEPKTQSITSVEENKQSTDDYEPSEQFKMSREEIEQSVENKNSITTDETLKQPILIIEELSHPAVLIEKLEEITIDKPQQQSITSNEEDTTQMTNEYEKMEHNKLDEPTNQSIIPTEENKQSTDDHEQSQQFTTSQEEIEQSVENKNPITTDETLEQPTFIITEVSQPVVLNENLEQITIEEPQQQSMSSNEEDKQMTNKYERLEQTLALIKEIEQSVKNKSSITEADQSISTNEEEEDELYLILNENIKQSNVEIEPSEQSTIAIEDKTHEQLNTSTEANNISTIEYEKLEQPISNESSSITNQRLEQLTTEQPLQSIVSNDNEDIKQFTVEPEKSNQSPVQIEQNEESIENQINIESTPDLSSNKDFQQTTPTKLDNYHIPVDENSEQHTTKQSSQDEISDEKTCIKNNSSIITNKKLEKPTVIELPQPITLNEDISKSTIENQEFIADTENLTQTIVPSQENPHCPTSDEQLTQPKILVNQPEQRTVPAEQPLLTTATIVKGPRYSDVVNRQLPKATNESAKPTDSFKKQDYSIESKKKIISPIVTIETPKQCINTADETEQVPLISTIKEPEQSEVLLEKQEPSTTIIEDAHDTSIISNGENQISSTKSNKSRRSNAKRRKSKKSSVTIENSPQNIINNNDDDDDNEEKIETSLPSQNLKSIIPEQQTSNIESEIEKSLTTLNRSSHDNTFTNHSNPQNSSALRSRKNKKKTTTTASIEKSSSPINSTTTDNRNMLIKAFLFNYSFQRITTYRWLSKTHQPSLFEPKWASIFAKATTNSYLPSSSTSVNNNKKPFIMLFPPPNVTGTVHLGHALTTSVHDCLLRWHTMQQKSYARCVPGYDHAGIATQVIVEKHIAPQTREQLGREKFLEECYQWSSNYRQTIETQLKRLCPLFDWSNAYFTMDKNLVEYVRDSFLHLYNNGLIYRDRRIVNWCCQLRSVVSDIEVDSKEINGREKFSIPGYKKDIELGILYNIAYKIIDEQQDKEIIVSTTRPETILADTGIAVHPNDSRYISLKNKFVQNPFNPQDYLPIIFDENVDQNFGTGAVKLTPGHDTFDYTLAMKHKLEIRTMLNDQGYVQLDLNHPYYHELNNLHRYDAREKVLQLLENKGLRRGEKEQEKMIIPLCSRTGDIIEPMVKEQWFLDTTEMCRQASSIVDNNNLKLTPSSTCKVWKYWLDSPRPWCLSRQLWWGHSIPMYRCSINNKSSEYKWIGAKSLEEAKIKAKELFPNIPLNSIHIEQDQDVLDTWFSSGLLPMSIFNKNNSQEFPTTLLETGYDIMFFWVARMVMLSLKLTNQLPFHEVLFHGLICDSNGKKMSKSLGNIIDPMDVINGINLQSLQKRLEQSHLSRNEIERAKRAQAIQYPSGIEPIGSDGLRLCLLSHDIFHQSIRFDPTQFDYVARYCNKFWNAYKYVKEFALADMNFHHENISNINYEQIEKLVKDRLVDRWILNELNKTIGKVNECLNNYTFHLAIVRLRDSFLKDFCDFYIEFSKIPIKQQSIDNIKSNVQILLYYLLKQYLILYHPFLPAMTEELWEDLTNGKQGYLIHQLYPTMKNIENINPIDSQVVQIIRLILKNATYFKQMLRLSRDSDIIIHFYNQDKEDLSIHVETYLTEIRTITRLNNIHVCRSSSSLNNSFNLSKFSFRDYITDNIELIFNLNDNKQSRELVEKHEERLSKQVDKLHDDIGVNEITMKFYQENNDLETLEREQRRREILLDDLKLTQQRHERFVELAQKRTIIEKKNKNHS
ncbi:unnamed protein product [Rotaria sordida]|uniref:valine--tRNA ligase n=1 Tax=Rotaria sordida TaxID=392033 RepID=A0A818KB27_9BILA|nr:unnamed protein product [Rotaria sordida]